MTGSGRRWYDSWENRLGRLLVRNDGYHVDLDEIVFRQRSLDGGPGWRVPGEELLVGRVVFFEIRDVSEVGVRSDHVLKTCPCRLEGRFQVQKCLPRLSRYTNR